MGEKRPLLKTAGTKGLWVAFWEEWDSRAFSGSSSNSRGVSSLLPESSRTSKAVGGWGWAATAHLASPVPAAPITRLVDTWTRRKPCFS